MLCETGISTVRRKLLWLICLSALIAATRGTVAATISIGGQNLDFEILGKNGPVVVFEAGLGNETSTWRLTAPAVSRIGRAFLYDRAGLGKSVPLRRRDVPITAEDAAKSLHALLLKADLMPPYILVGHSLGGLYVQMFARQYPQDVAGVVLLDSASSEAPPQLKTRARLEAGSAAYLEEAGVAASNQQVRDAGRFPDVPLTVIAATDHGPFFRSWERVLMRLQRGLATLSPQGQLVIAQGSGHDIQLDRPALVVSAIRSLVRKLKEPRRALERSF
jgi:pimeloyl-ACP methyl ester carboxylesterase